MYVGLLTTFTGDHTTASIQEDRWDCMADHKSAMDISFEFGRHELCLRSEITHRINPEDALLTPEMSPKYFLRNLPDPPAERTDMSTSEIWRFAGGICIYPNSFREDDRAIAFAEYDASQHTGNALILTKNTSLKRLMLTFHTCNLDITATEIRQQTIDQLSQLW